MKQWIACLPLAACTLGAHAQSNVTIYGAVDAALTYVNNSGGKSAVQAASGGRAGDKFGLTGTEDLGGGTSAIFTLEAGFNIMNGVSQPSNTLFGRQAFVGLSDRTWGTLTIGHQYSMTNDYFVPLSTAFMFAGGMGATLGDLDGSWNYNKINNVVKYQSIDYRGLKFSTMFSFGNAAGDFSKDRTYGFGASYTTGGLSIAGAYMNMRTPGTSIFGNATAATQGGAYTNTVTNPIFQNYVTANSEQVVGGGAKYVFGNSQISAMYSNVRFLDIVQTASNRNVQPNASFNNYQINYGYNFSPSTMVGVGYQYSAAPHSHYNSFEGGAAYNFSKTTYVYGIAVWQHASGHDSTGAAAVADIFGLTASTTPNQLAFRIGLRKLF